MSAAVPTLALGTVTRGAPFARRLVTGVLVLCALLGLGLLALSLVPNAVLVGRLMGAAGEARAGANTLELAASLDMRLRLAAALLLALTAGLFVVRGTASELVAAAQHAIEWPAPNWWVLGSVGGSMFAAAAVRIVFLSQPMRYDEALTFNEFASRPLYYGLSFYPDPNNHLMNTLLMHAVYVVLGNQPWVLRLPAFVGGVLLVPATFWLARLLYAERSAVFAAALVAVGSYLVEYSTNARGYTLQALCFVLFFALVVLAVRFERRGALLLGAVVAALGAYALPTMLYGVAVVCLWALFQRRSQVAALVTTGLVVGLGTTLLYLPVLIISGADKLVGNRFVVPLTLGELGPELARSLARTWALWNRDIPFPLAALLVVGFCVSVFWEVRGKAVPLGLLAPAVCLVLVVVQRVAPFERVWLFLLPLYFLIAAAGLSRFVHGRLLAVVFGVAMGYVTLTSGSILRSDETGVFPDAEAVTQMLAPRLAPDDAVVTQLPASLPELQYYFPRSGLPNDVLVRPAGDAQRVWLIARPGAGADVAGWPSVSEVQRFASATVYELQR